MSAKDESQTFFEAESLREKSLIVEVPSAPPTVHRRHRPLLERPYRGVGVEADVYEEKGRSGKVWQSWFILGLAIALTTPAGIVTMMMGEWAIVLIAAPFVLLFLIGAVRSLRAEQKLKQASRNRRLHNRGN